jgi:hypothetical protein
MPETARRGRRRPAAVAAEGRDVPKTSELYHKSNILI